MRLRKYKKDHLQKSNEAQQHPAILTSPTSETNENSALQFWTKHPTKPVFVDLYPFKYGESKNPSPRWGGPFSGRPQLIEELFPILKEVIEYSAPGTVTSYLHTLRAWWRIFDEVEKRASESGLHVPPVVQAKDINDLHHRRAFEGTIRNSTFALFVRLVNTVLRIQGNPVLYWEFTKDASAKRHLPPQWQIDKIRIELKHAWFAVLDRWERADYLIKSSLQGNLALAEDSRESENKTPSIQFGQSQLKLDEIPLLQGYLAIREAMQSAGEALPRTESVRTQFTKREFHRREWSRVEALKGFYPDSNDIRVAFHLCLANTGWNISVLLDLDCTQPLIESHPKDSSRYLLHGFKARGNSHQISEGLFKSQGSAGVIIQRLTQRTEPLRAQLKLDLEDLKAQLASLHPSAELSKETASLKKKIALFERGVRSPWIYATQGGIEWLDSKTYWRSTSRQRNENFLDEFIGKINKNLPSQKALQPLRASDFRDAFAAYAYRISGGSILYVMKVLGHRSPNTTQSYLDNNILREESHRLYRGVTNAVWKEIKIHGAIDLTIIAKISRDGEVSTEERTRLIEYRKLSRSRIGVACKAPKNPPRHIAPDFKNDGTSVCVNHRCTLCFENAVILPESLDGLCCRLAELYKIQEGMSVVAFAESSFPEEIRNTELALSCFNKEKVSESLSAWKSKIALGLHRAVDLDGALK